MKNTNKKRKLLFLLLIFGSFVAFAAAVSLESATSFSNSENSKNKEKEPVFAPFLPNESKIYHIQAVNGRYLAADGSSNEAYTVANISDATSSADVEWKFVEHSSGRWHIQRAAGGNKPRLRADGESPTDMQATSSSGTWTQYIFEESSRFEGAYHITASESGHNSNRLQANVDGNSYKVTTASTGNAVSFNITEVEISADIVIPDKVDFSHFYSGKEYPINVAHRGKWEGKNVPENSKASMDKAENDDKVDWMEIDVKPSNIILNPAGTAVTSMQAIIFHDDKPHRLVSETNWADNDLVYDKDMTGSSLSDRFGNETNEKLLTFEEFFVYVKDNITKPINLDISNKSYMSARIDSGSQVYNSVYDSLFLKAVDLIFKHKLNDQIFLKNSYDTNYYIWGTGADNTDRNGVFATVQSIFNYYNQQDPDIKTGILYAPKFGDETVDSDDYYSDWLGVADGTFTHTATVVGAEVRLKADNGDNTDKIKEYISDLQGEGIKIGIFSEGTVACEGTWENNATRKYVDVGADKRASFEWLSETSHNYDYIINDFPDQLDSYKNKQAYGSLPSSTVEDPKSISNAFSGVTNGGFSIMGFLVDAGRIAQDYEIVLAEVIKDDGVLWRFGLTGKGKVYVDRFTKWGDYWRMEYWDPRETGLLSDVSSGKIWLGATVSELETRIYVGTPDGTFDCLYLAYGISNSEMDGQFGPDATDSNNYELAYNIFYGLTSTHSESICRTDMFSAAYNNYFKTSLADYTDPESTFSFLNDVNPYFSVPNTNLSTSNTNAFNGETVSSCTPRDEVPTELTSVVEGNLYLIIGQSNAAGRGTLPGVLEAYEGVSVLDDNGDFVPALPNLNNYSTIKKDIVQGYNLGYTFGGHMHHVTAEEVKLVVNAQGGTSISQWEKGASDGFFQEAVDRTNVALGNSDTQLAGIIWHQGEANRSSSSYVGDLQQLMADFREEFGIPDLPFIAGQLSQERSDNSTFNSNILDIVDDITAVASSDDLTTSDETHFTTEALRDFGDRYAIEMLKIQNKYTPNNLPTHPEFVLAETFTPLADQVYHIKSTQGNLLAGDAETADASAVSTTTVGPSVEWIFTPKDDGDDSTNYYHIDLNAGGTKSRLYTKESEFAIMTKTIYSGDNTYFALQESSEFPGSYTITAVDYAELDYQRLFLNPDGEAGMTDIGSTGAWATFEFIEVEETAEAATFTPVTDQVYHIKSNSGRLLAGDAEAAETSAVSTTTVGPSVEWIFTPLDDGDATTNYYHIDLNAGGTKSRLYTKDSEYALMTKDIYSGTNTYFAMQENSPGTGTYHITAVDEDNADYKRLFLNPDGQAGMASTASTGSWTTFELVEVEETVEAATFTPVTDQVYHIKSNSGRLLAGDAEAAETSAVSTTIVGPSVEWIFTPLDDGDATTNYYHIDLNAGGTKSRLYTKDSEYALMTKDIYSGTNTYFAMQENSPGTGTYHITAVDEDNADYQRLFLNPDGQAGMASTASTGSWTTFELVEVEETVEAATFTPVTDQVYHIKSNSGRLLAGDAEAAETSAVPTTTLGSSVEWILTPLDDDDATTNYYHIDLNAGGTKSRLYTKDSEYALMTKDIYSGTNTYFELQENSPGTGTYHITAVDEDNADYQRLFLNPDGQAGMASIASTGSWTTFEFVEVDPTPDIETFDPDTSKVYYITALNGKRLSANGSNSPEGVSSTTFGTEVEWKFIANGSGQYYIQLNSGGSNPRLRSDGTALANMNDTNNDGVNAQFILQEKTPDSGEFHITAINGYSGFNRLFMNTNGTVGMGDTSSTGSWTTFTLLEEELPGTPYAPDENQIYYITSEFNGRILAGDPVTEEVTTIAPMHLGIENTLWKFVKTTDPALEDEDYYHIDLASSTGDTRLAGDPGLGNGDAYMTRDIFDGDKTYWQIVQVTPTVFAFRLAGIVSDGYFGSLGVDSVHLDAVWINDQPQAASNKRFNIEPYTGTPLKANFALLEESDSDYYLYPNPSSDIISVNGLASGETLFMYDILGKKILETREKEIDISTLSNGVYFLKTANGENVFKFIKE